MNAKKALVSLICNLMTAALVIYSVGQFFLRSGDGNMQVIGSACFRYFTVDSNILAAIVSLFVIPYDLRALKKGSAIIPAWALRSKFVGTVAVTVTFLTVMCFLGPVQGFGMMFAGCNLHMHLTCPLLAILSYTCFEVGEPFRRRDILLGVLPTLVYGTLYFFMVIVFSVWPDFYGFNMGGHWPVSFITMVAGTYLLALVLHTVHRRASEVSFYSL